MEAAADGGGEDGAAEASSRRRRPDKGICACHARGGLASASAVVAATILLILLAPALPTGRAFMLRPPVSTQLPTIPHRRTSVVTAGGRGFYEYDGDPFWFEGGRPITESLVGERRRRRERRRLGEAADDEPVEPMEDQEAFWKRKDRERAERRKKAAAGPDPSQQRLPPALRALCHQEISRLRAAFGGSEAAGGDGGGLRLTGCAIMLHGGASVAWEQRWYQLPGEFGAGGRQAEGDAGDNYTPSYPGRGGGETATFEVTTEAGGGGGYEWLDGAVGGDWGGVGGGGAEQQQAQGSWVALPMRWHREGFPVGVLFVRLAGAQGEEASTLRRRLRLEARELARSLMETPEMRAKFGEWRSRGGGAAAATDDPNALPSSSSSDVESSHHHHHGHHHEWDGGDSVTTSGGDAEEEASSSGVKVTGVDQQQRLDAVIWKLALPLSLSLALEPLCSMVDTYFVGKRMGPRSLSAFALADRVFVIGFFLINFSVATPTTPLVARLRAMGQADVAFSLVLRLGIGTLLFGLALVPVLQRLAAPIISLLSGGSASLVEKGVLASSIEYYSVRALSAPAVLLNALAVGALRGFLDTTTPLYVVSAAFLLDYSLQPQWFAWLLPKKALTPTTLPGFGITTVLADYAATFFYALKLAALYRALLLTRDGNDNLFLAFRRGMRRRRRRWKERLQGAARGWKAEMGKGWWMLRRAAQREEDEEEEELPYMLEEEWDDDVDASTSTPASRRWAWASALWRPRAGESLAPALWKFASQGLSVFTRSVLYQLLVMAASYSLVARSGRPAELAAHQLGMQLWLLPSVVLDSLAIVGQGLVADCLGRARVARARKVAKSLLRYGALSGAAVGLGYLLGARAILGWISPDAKVAAMVRPIMWVLALLVPVTSIVQVGGGVLQGATDFDYQARLMVLCVTVAGGALHWAGQSGRHGLLPVWLSLLLFQGLRAVGFAYRFWRDPRCPLSILPPRDANAPSPLAMLRDRVLALVRLDTLLADDAWNAGLIANPARLLRPKPRTPQIRPEDID